MALGCCALAVLIEFCSQNDIYKVINIYKGGNRKNMLLFRLGYKAALVAIKDRNFNFVLNFFSFRIFNIIVLILYQDTTKDRYVLILHKFFYLKNRIKFSDYFKTCVKDRNILILQNNL